MVLLLLEEHRVGGGGQLELEVALLGQLKSARPIWQLIGGTN